MKSIHHRSLKFRLISSTTTCAHLVRDRRESIYICNSAVSTYTHLLNIPSSKSFSIPTPSLSIFLRIALSSFPIHATQIKLKHEGSVRISNKLSILLHLCLASLYTAGLYPQIRLYILIQAFTSFYLLTYNYVLHLS